MSAALKKAAPRKANKRTTKPHTFKVGKDAKRNTAGRPRGSQNKISVEVKEAVVNAAMNIGYDGKGEGGLIGYLEKMAKIEPRSFMSLLGRCVPVNLVMKGTIQHEILTPEQLIAQLKERGVPVERIFGPPVQPVMIEGTVVKTDSFGRAVPDTPNNSGENAKPQPMFTGLAPPREAAKVQLPPKKEEDPE